MAEVEGAFNLRDLASLARDAGYPVKPGMIWRSGFLTNVSQNGYDEFERLGVKTVIDLREPEEIAAMPSAWREGVNEIALRNIYPGKFDNSILMTWGTDLTLEEARRRRFETYKKMPAEFVQVVGHVFNLLAEPGTYPMLLHCMGGKDRTGFLGSLILSHLGVDKDTIVSEYMANADKTSAPEPRAIEKLAELYQMKDTGEESRQAMLETLPDHLLASLKVIDDEYGGLWGYLKDAAGVSESGLRQARRNLLVE